MRKIITGFLIIILILCSCGCADKSKLENYVTNYDEVVTLLRDSFNDNKIIITDWKLDKTQKEAGMQKVIDQNEQSLKQFGNGTWYLSVNGIQVTVFVRNHIAEMITYYDGSYYNTKYTKTYEDNRPKIDIVATEASDVFKG